MCILSLFACFKSPSSNSKMENGTPSKEEQPLPFFSLEKIKIRASTPKPEEESYLDALNRVFEMKQNKQTEYDLEESSGTSYTRVNGYHDDHLLKYVRSLLEMEIKSIKDIFDNEIESLSVEKKIESIVRVVFEVKKDFISSSLKLSPEKRITSLAELCRREYFSYTICEFIALHLEQLLEKKFDDSEMDKNRRRLKKVFDGDGGFQFVYRRLPGKITSSTFRKEIKKVEELFRSYMQTHPETILTTICQKKNAI